MNSKMLYIHKWMKFMYLTLLCSAKEEDDIIATGHKQKPWQIFRSWHLSERSKKPMTHPTIDKLQLQQFSLRNMEGVCEKDGLFNRICPYNQLQEFNPVWNRAIDPLIERAHTGNTIFNHSPTRHIIAVQHLSQELISLFSLIFNNFLSGV